MKIEKFPYHSLKSFTSEQARLHTVLSRLFPSGETSFPVLNAVNKMLNEEISMSLKAEFQSYTVSSLPQYLSALPDHFVGLSVRLNPFVQNILLEFDSDLAFGLIDCVLGGAGSSPRLARPTTALEEGVLQFAVIKVLRVINPFMGKKKHQLKLGKVVHRLKTVHHLYSDEQKLYIFTFPSQINDVQGYIRLVFPESLLEAFEFDDQSMQTALGFSEEKRKQRLLAVTQQKCILWAEAGKVTLSAAELEALEIGDIILFDEFYADFEDGHIQNKVQLRVGEGQGGYLDARVSSKKDSYEFSVEHVINE